MTEITPKEPTPHKSFFANNARGQFMKIALGTFGAAALATAAGILFKELNEPGIPVAGLDNATGLPTGIASAMATNTQESTATSTQDVAFGVEKVPTIDMVTEVGFSPDEVDLVKNSAGQWVVVEKGADPNVADNVDARWNPEQKVLERKWGADMEQYILEMARIIPSGYDQDLDLDQQLKIESQFNGIRIVLRFTISKNPNHKELDQAVLRFARYDGKRLEVNSKEFQSGWIFFELPSGERIGEYRAIPVYDFVSPIK